MKRMRLRTLSLFFAAVLTLTAITGSYGSVPVNAGEEDAITVDSDSGDDGDANTDSEDRNDDSESDSGDSKDDGNSDDGGDSGDDSQGEGKQDDSGQDDSGNGQGDDNGSGGGEQDPSAPADPGQSTDPSAPTDPAQPTDPAAPVDPSQPTDPAAPVDPAQPTDPAAPVDPTAPVDPSQPTDPATPVDPAQPTDPAVDPGEADPTEAAPTDEADPTIQNPTDNLPVEAEPTEEEEEEVEFDETIVADGVTIRIQADKGVFPEGTYFEADKVTDSGKIETIENTIENTSGKEVDKSVTFDIKTYDKEHNRIQPDTSKGKVRVTFGNIDCDADQTLEAFYVNDNLESAKKVGSSEKGEKKVEFPVNHFSLYGYGILKNQSSKGIEYIIKVVDQDGNPIAGADVTITDKQNKDSQGTSLTIKTDTEGVAGKFTHKMGNQTSTKVVLNGVTLAEGVNYPTNEPFNAGHGYYFDLTGDPLVINLHYDTIKYHNNAPEGRTVTGSMVDQVIYAGSKEKLTKNAFEIKGFKFIGWSGSADGSVEYEDEYEYECKSETQNKELNLYAQWLPDTNGVDSATAYLVAPWANNGGGKFELDDKKTGVTPTSNDAEFFIPIGVEKSGSIDNFVNTYYSQFVRKNHDDFDSHVKFGAFLADFEKEMHGFKVIVKDGTITVVNKEYSYSSTLNKITWYVAKNESSDYNKVGWHVDGFTTWNKVDAAYKVTFHSNGGTPVAQQTVSYNGKVTKPENPTKNNNKFEGWFRDEACTTEYDFDSKVIGDLELYAGWSEEHSLKIKIYDDDTNTLITSDSPVSYKLKLDDEEISEVSANGITVSNGTKYRITDIEITDPYKYSGYQVDGGSVDTSNPDAITGTVIADTEVVIHVSRLKVTVSFDTDGGFPVPEDQIISKGSQATEPDEKPVSDGRKFNGWYSDKDTQDKYDFTTTVSGDMTLYAGYDPDMTISGNATIHVRIPSESLKPKPHEETIKKPNPCIGYPIKNYLKVGTAKVTSFIAATYSSYVEDDLNDHVIDPAVREPSSNGYLAIKEGGRLDCWIAKMDGKNYILVVENGKLYKADPATFEFYCIKKPESDKNYHIEADVVWEEMDFLPLTISGNSLEVTYDGQEHVVEGFTPTEVQVGTGVNQITGITAVAKGTEVGTHETVFSGTPIIQGGMKINIAPLYKITYVPGKLVIKPRQYTVSFNTMGGEPTVPSQSVSEGSAATEPGTRPEKAGFVFKGWFEDAEGNDPYDFSTPITSDKEIFAGYESDMSVLVNDAKTFIQIPGASEVVEKTIKHGAGEAVASYGDAGYLKLGSTKLTKYVTDQYVSYAESDVGDHVLEHIFIENGEHEYAGNKYWLKNYETSQTIEAVLNDETWIGDLSTLRWYVIKNYDNSTNVKTWHVDGRVNWTKVDPSKELSIYQLTVLQ